MEQKKPKIIVDSREPRKYLTYLEKFGAEVVEQTLACGDFLVSSSTIIERKTKDDFVSSIIDQRLFYQAKQMAENYSNPVFIIEEDGKNPKISLNALFGAYGCLIVDFGVSLIFSFNEQQTANIVYSIARYEQISKKVQLKANPLKKIKTLQLRQRTLIESLPMVGPNIAKELLDRFKSPINIFLATEKELAETKMIGKERANLIRATLDSVYQE
ncbi:MAG: ERCC4 domain-containing protein [Candidatus Anstonellaceae archaeon]